jgi:SP family sugar:H+ symporter-like MFS transporter
VKVASQSVGWKPTTTFTEIRASVAAQGGLGAKVVKGANLAHDEKTGEYRNEAES